MFSRFCNEKGEGGYPILNSKLSPRVGIRDLLPSLRFELILHREDQKIIHPVALHEVIP